MVGFPDKDVQDDALLESSRSMRRSSKYDVFHSELKSRSMETGS